MLNACISFPCQSTLLLNRVTAAVLSDWAGGPHCYNKNISFQCYEYAVLCRPKIVDVEHGEQKQRTKNNSLYDMTSSQEIIMVTVKNNWLKLNSLNSYVNKTVHHCTKRKSKIICLWGKYSWYGRMYIALIQSKAAQSAFNHYYLSIPIKGSI